jgi:glycosyltransferase involved in cell wall biosynthesis
MGIQGIDVSIIIPVYNSELFLRECLDSVLAQKYDKYEVIMVNDGSADQSGAIIDEYSRNDKRFISIHQENQGAGGARNTGIGAAKGQYILFLDSDDTLDKDTLSDLIPVALENELDMIRMNWKQVPQNYIDPMHGADTDRKLTQSEFMAYYADNLMKFTFISILYRTEIIRENKLLFRTRFAEDILFNMQALLLCKSYYLTEKAYYYYHKANENSLSSVFFDSSELILERNKAVLEMLVSVDKLTANVISIENKQKLFRQIFRHATMRYRTLFDSVIEDFIANKTECGCKLAFWGAGEIGIKYLGYSKGPHYKNLVFVDNDIGKQGGFFYGYPVIAPEELCDPKYADYKNIIASRFYIETYAKMKKLRIIRNFMDLRLDIGENEQYDRQLRAMDNLYEEIVNTGIEIEYPCKNQKGD